MNNNKPRSITMEDTMILCGFGCLLLISYKIGKRVGSIEGWNRGTVMAYERVLDILM